MGLLVKSLIMTRAYTQNAGQQRARRSLVSGTAQCRDVNNNLHSRLRGAWNWMKWTMEDEDCRERLI